MEFRATRRPVDGCSRRDALWCVVPPLVAPRLIATGLLCFLLAWNEFLFVLILTRTLASHTVPIAAASFMTEQFIEWDKIAATAAAAVIPIVILMTVVQKYFVQGRTFGAVKG